MYSSYKISPNELEKMIMKGKQERRKARMKEVRKQSNDIASNVRKLVAVEKKLQISNQKALMKSHLLVKKEEQVELVQKAVEDSCKYFGNSFKMACEMERGNLKIGEEQLHKSKAIERGKKANKWLKQNIADENKENKRRYEAKMASKSIEMKRTRRIISSPSKKKEKENENINNNVKQSCKYVEEEFDTNQPEMNALINAERIADNFAKIEENKKELLLKNKKIAWDRHIKALKKETLSKEYSEFLKNLKQADEVDRLERKKNILLSHVFQGQLSLTKNTNDSCRILIEKNGSDETDQNHPIKSLKSLADELSNKLKIIDSEDHSVNDENEDKTLVDFTSKENDKLENREALMNSNEESMHSIIPSCGSFLRALHADKSSSFENSSIINESNDKLKNFIPLDQSAEIALSLSSDNVENKSDCSVVPSTEKYSLSSNSNQTSSAIKAYCIDVPYDSPTDSKDSCLSDSSKCLTSLQSNCVNISETLKLNKQLATYLMKVTAKKLERKGMLKKIDSVQSSSENDSLLGYLTQDFCSDDDMFGISRSKRPLDSSIKHIHAIENIDEMQALTKQISFHHKNIHNNLHKIRQFNEELESMHEVIEKDISGSPMNSERLRPSDTYTTRKFAPLEVEHCSVYPHELSTIQEVSSLNLSDVEISAQESLAVSSSMPDINISRCGALKQIIREDHFELTAKNHSVEDEVCCLPHSKLSNSVNENDRLSLLMSSPSSNSYGESFGSFKTMSFQKQCDQSCHSKTSDLFSESRKNIGHMRDSHLLNRYLTLGSSENDSISLGSSALNFSDFNLETDELIDSCFQFATSRHLDLGCDEDELQQQGNCLSFGAFSNLETRRDHAPCTPPKQMLSQDERVARSQSTPKKKTALLFAEDDVGITDEPDLTFADSQVSSVNSSIITLTSPQRPSMQNVHSSMGLTTSESSISFAEIARFSSKNADYDVSHLVDSSFDAPNYITVAEHPFSPDSAPKNFDSTDNILDVPSHEDITNRLDSFNHLESTLESLTTVVPFHHDNEFSTFTSNLITCFPMS